MSKTRRHILALAFATATVAVASLVGASVTPANAATLDPVDDPAYWSQIWDHIGALNPSSTLQPTADWATYESGWAADSYLADSASAAAAKVVIDAEGAETTAMEVAGSLPAESTLLGLSGGAFPAVAAGVGALALGYQVGTTTTRLLHIDIRGLIGGGAPSGSGPSFTPTGRIIYSYAASISPNWGGGAGFLANIEVKDNSTGSLLGVGSTTDCASPSANCDNYSQSKYAELIATGWAQSSAVLSGCTSACTEFAAIPRRGVGIGVTGISASGTPDRTYAGAGPQADPGTGSAKAGNVRAAIEANPTLHRQYDCKLDPSHYSCPAIVPPPPTTPPITIGSLPWVPIYLPSVFPGETLDTYAERLRSKQWLGAISAIDDPMLYPAGTPAMQLQPGTITSVSITTGTGVVTVPIYDPLTGLAAHWPLNPPKIETATSPVTIKQVPATYVPAGGGGIHMPTISFGCQFPFGFICWAQDVTGWFNVPAQAPEFNFVIPDQTVAGHTYHVGSHYDVNLNVMDSYMSTFRSILSVVIWVGGIYWLAVRLLGFNPGGDPGEAIDEGMGFDGS